MYIPPKSESPLPHQSETKRPKLPKNRHFVTIPLRFLSVLKVVSLRTNQETSSVAKITGHARVRCTVFFIIRYQLVGILRSNAIKLYF